MRKSRIIAKVVASPSWITKDGMGPRRPTPQPYRQQGDAHGPHRRGCIVGVFIYVMLLSLMTLLFLALSLFPSLSLSYSALPRE